MTPKLGCGGGEGCKGKVEGSPSSERPRAETGHMRNTPQEAPPAYTLFSWKKNSWFVVILVLLPFFASGSVSISPALARPKSRGCVGSPVKASR